MNTLKLFPFLFVLISGAWIEPLFAQSGDLLIYGGKIVNGSATEPYEADILIEADSIVFIGEINKDSVHAGKVIDASGKIITPGFIDMHAHGDPLATPEFQNFLAMGVTTILLGQDGSSVTDGSYQEWFKEVTQAQPGINIAALSGHGSLRGRAELGEDVEVFERDIETMRKQLSQDIDAGSFGLSLGLEYVPGLYAGREELIGLAKTVGARDGLIVSHMRSEDDARIEASLDELATLGKYARVQASHLKVVYGKGEDRAQQILDLLDDYRSDNIQISADTYPYAASFTGIGIVFPEYAKTEAGWQQAMQENPELLREFLISKVQQRNGPGAILFGTGKYAGMTLEEAAEMENKTPVDLLLEMGPRGASAAHFVMNEALQDRIAIADQVMISSDGSPTMRHPRGYGSFAKIIRKYVMEEERLTIEDAVHKMSGLPAQTLGLTDRGYLKKGYKADILVFDPANVQDLADFEDPHQLAKGFDWVIVNGKVAKQDSSFSEDRFGMVLKSN